MVVVVGILLSWGFSVETGIPKFWRGYPTAYSWRGYPGIPVFMSNSGSFTFTLQIVGATCKIGYFDLISNVRN